MSSFPLHFFIHDSQPFSCEPPRNGEGSASLPPPPLLLIGPPGSGKSSLALQAAISAARAGGHVLIICHIESGMMQLAHRPTEGAAGRAVIPGHGRPLPQVPLSSIDTDVLARIEVIGVGAAGDLGHSSASAGAPAPHQPTALGEACRALSAVGLLASHLVQSRRRKDMGRMGSDVNDNVTEFEEVEAGYVGVSVASPTGWAADINDAQAEDQQSAEPGASSLGGKESACHLCVPILPPSVLPRLIIIEDYLIINTPHQGQPPQGASSNQDATPDVRAAAALLALLKNTTQALADAGAPDCYSIYVSTDSAPVAIPKGSIDSTGGGRLQAPSICPFYPSLASHPWAVNPRYTVCSLRCGHLPAEPPAPPLPFTHARCEEVLHGMPVPGTATGFEFCFVASQGGEHNRYLHAADTCRVLSPLRALQK